METVNVPHFLLVEDNKLALMALEAQIKRAGYRFTSAMDGEQAFGLYTSHDFDLIITDLGLPGMSGLELCQSIREWERNQNKKAVPIVALTGHVEAEIEEQNLTINKVVTKPMRAEMLQLILGEFGLGNGESEKSF